MSSSIEFNNFRLAFPESLATLGAAKQAQLERWQRLLSNLCEEERAVDAAGWVPDWEVFRATEPTKSETAGLRPEHLVSPAGSLGTALCFLLHYPTFTTKLAIDGKVFDRTNPTILRLALSGFDDENTFWLDSFCRRKAARTMAGARFQPDKHVEPALLNHHHEWLDLCLRKSAAKVLVVFGQQNEVLLRGKWGKRLAEMKLWGDYNDISLWMLSPENDDSRIEQIVLFVWHPEHVSRQDSIEKGRIYDKQLGLAAQLVRIVRSEEQAHYNEISCTNESSLARAVAAAEATEESKFAVIKRGKTKRKLGNGLVQEEVAIEVACATCQYPRTDVTPFYFESHSSAGGGRAYSAPYTQCPRCGKARTFVPVDTNIAHVTRDTNKRAKKST